MTSESVRTYKITPYVVDEWIASYVVYLTDDPHADFADRLNISRDLAKAVSYKLVYSVPAMHHHFTMGQSIQAEHTAEYVSRMASRGASIELIIEHLQEMAISANKREEKARLRYLPKVQP